MLFDAHWHAFRVLGGVPERGIYDNMKTAVDRVGRGKAREINIRFLAMANGCVDGVDAPPDGIDGPIMRVAPMLVLKPHRTGPDLARDIATCAAVTHNEPGAIASAVAWVRLLALLSAGTGGPDRKDILELFLETHALLEGPTCYRPRGGGMLGRFEGTLTEFLRQTVPDGLAKGLSILEFGDLTYSGAFLLETLPVTLYIIARHGDDPDPAIRAAVNHTRDNDTIASRVASAMGALHGMDAFRPDWVTGLLGRTGADDDGRVQALVARATAGPTIPGR